jgi:hypothetical protein
VESVEFHLILSDFGAGCGVLQCDQFKNRYCPIGVQSEKLTFRIDPMISEGVVQSTFNLHGISNFAGKKTLKRNWHT